MMAPPQDREDFAVGFSLTEDIIRSSSEIESLAVIEQDVGIELRVGLAEPHGSAFHERRRYLAGPTGCGLCGIEMLAEAMRAPMTITDPPCVLAARHRARAAWARRVAIVVSADPRGAWRGLLPAPRECHRPARTPAVTMRSTSSPAPWRALDNRAKVASPSSPAGCRSR